LRRFCFASRVNPCPQIRDNAFTLHAFFCFIPLEYTHMSTADALVTIIPALIESGSTLVTVSELMAARGITMVAGNCCQSGK
jgi:hypothetical protein